MSEPEYVIDGLLTLLGYVPLYGTFARGSWLYLIHESRHELQALDAARSDEPGLGPFLLRALILTPFDSLVFGLKLGEPRDVWITDENPWCVVSLRCSARRESVEKCIYGLRELPSVMHSGIRVMKIREVCSKAALLSWSPRLGPVALDPSVRVEPLNSLVKVRQGIRVTCQGLNML